MGQQLEDPCAYGAKTATYKVFARMLASGNPPNNWHELMRNAEANHGRLERINRQH